MSPELLLGIAAVVLGAILGSFLNALSFRFNTGRSMGGRSRCMHCGHGLSALDLVPVLSYLALRGRCRHCGARISIQYPLVELSAALLALLVYRTHPPLTEAGLEPLPFLFWLLVWMIILFTVVYDLRHKIIPWSCSLLLIALSLVWLFVSFAPTVHFILPSTLWLLAGPSLAAPLLFISLISGGRAMGWGDGVLQLSLGWLLGFTAGLTALMLAFWSGALVGIALLVAQKGLTMRSEVPFAPFLAFGALIAHFFHVDFFSTLLYFW